MRGVVARRRAASDVAGPARLADLGRTRGQAALSLERLHKLRKHTGGGPSCRARGGGSAVGGVPHLLQVEIDRGLVLARRRRLGDREAHAPREGLLVPCARRDGHVRAGGERTHDMQPKTQHGHAWVRAGGWRVPLHGTSSPPWASMQARKERISGPHASEPARRVFTRTLCMSPLSRIRPIAERARPRLRVLGPRRRRSYSEARSLPATWHSDQRSAADRFGLTPRRGAAAAVLQARLAAPIAAPLLHTGRPAALATTHPAAHAAAPISRGPGLLTPCALCPLRHSRALCAGGWRDGFLLPRAACKRVRLRSSSPDPHQQHARMLSTHARARIGAESARSKQSSRG